MSADLQNPVFTDEDKAREALEAVRWPNGAVCPHCGVTGDDVAKAKGKSARPGLYYCNACNEQFTATVKTVFERSHVPLTKWWLAMHLMGSSKKGISAHQLHRMLGVTYKTAWFMCHRIREAMRSGDLSPLGGAGKVVEADETYTGRLKGQPVRRGGASHKNTVLTLVERGGAARSFHVDSRAVDREKRLQSAISLEQLSTFTQEAGNLARLMADARDFALGFEDHNEPEASLQKCVAQIQEIFQAQKNQNQTPRSRKHSNPKER